MILAVAEMYCRGDTTRTATAIVEKF